MSQYVTFVLYEPSEKNEAPLPHRRPPHPGKAVADGPLLRNPPRAGPSHLQIHQQWVSRKITPSEKNPFFLSNDLNDNLH